MEARRISASSWSFAPRSGELVRWSAVMTGRSCLFEGEATGDAGSLSCCTVSCPTRAEDVEIAVRVEMIMSARPRGGLWVRLQVDSAL